MITYSVTITLQPSIEAEWIEWMKAAHIPDVLRTGCFSECRIHKIVEAEGEDPAYVMQYSCLSLEEYHRYRDTFAPALQKDHTERFGGRFRGSRQVLEEVARIESTAGS
jgi:Domain of unknown function (DUF4286)